MPRPLPVTDEIVERREERGPGLPASLLDLLQQTQVLGVHVPRAGPADVVVGDRVITPREGKPVDGVAWGLREDEACRRRNPAEVGRVVLLPPLGVRHDEAEIPPAAREDDPVDGPPDDVITSGNLYTLYGREVNIHSLKENFKVCIPRKFGNGRLAPC